MKSPLNASYPVLPLRDIVVFPHMIVPLFVGRDKSVRALEEVMQEDKQILLSNLSHGGFGQCFAIAETARWHG